MTQKKKNKLNTLHKQHPYKVEYEKLIQKSGKDRIIRDFKNGTHTYSVGLLFALVVTTPLVFMQPLSSSKPPTTTNLSLDTESVGSILTGMGGPEIIPSRNVDPLKAIQTEVLAPLDPVSFGQIEQTSFVTVTRVYNHLRVKNTVMPTTSAQISSDHGWRTPPCSGCSSDHKGIDFVPGFGEPVFSVADGMVVEIGGGGGYGNYVKIKHLMGNEDGAIEEWETLYAHMKNGSLPEDMIVGSVVKGGGTIGTVGNTGMSTGPHLHFELTVNGKNVDPLPLLGTHKVIVVSEEDYPDFMFVGETIKSVETEVRYE